jgi:transcriptional regulator with XRE-family HTH domain
MSDTPTDEFNRRLRLALTRAGISQAELGRRIGAHQNQVSSWVAGKRHPSFRHLAALVPVLEVDIDWLVLGRGVERPTSDDQIGRRLRDLGPELIELVELAREGGE